MIARPPNAYPANRTEVDFLRRFYWNGMSNLFPANVRKVDWCFWLLVFLFVRHKILLFCENILRPKITSNSHSVLIQFLPPSGAASPSNHFGAVDRAR